MGSPLFIILYSFLQLSLLNQVSKLLKQGDSVFAMDTGLKWNPAPVKEVK